LGDRGVFLLDARGNVASWSEGAQALLGYSAASVCGRHLSSLYPAEALKDDEPGRALRQAAGTSKLEEVTWLVRSNGSRLQAKVVLTALNDPSIYHAGGMPIGAAEAPDRPGGYLGVAWELAPPPQ
jgi:PAS domain S-box-containing protein